MSAEILLTKQGLWTLADLDGLPDDGRRYEIIDGSLLVSPPPSNYHQLLAFELASLLRSAQPAGYRVLSPGSVALGPGNYRQPDVLLLAETAVGRGQPLAAGPEDVLLAVEVMSPGSVTEDRITKPAMYARAGIEHYWRLEPNADRLTLHVYRLAGDVYAETALVRDEERVDIIEPLRLSLTPSQLRG